MRYVREREICVVRVKKIRVKKIRVKKIRVKNSYI
jgi:hypothetical protein